MKQMTFSALGFDRYAKTTRREIFLQEMDKAVPWARLIELIEPHYYAAPAPGQAGRRPVGLERMLRMYFLQHWFNLSDPAAEEALYDSHRSFACLSGAPRPVPWQPVEHRRAAIAVECTGRNAVINRGMISVSTDWQS